MKPVNRYTSNEFHDWQRMRLDGRFVIQDIDAWALVAADRDEPAAILELKRSSIPVRRWEPFEADRRNYASLLALANRAGIPLYVVYFLKGEPITDDSELAVFRLTSCDPMQGVKTYLTGEQFAERFPILIP